MSEPRYFDKQAMEFVRQAYMWAQYADDLTYAAEGRHRYAQNAREYLQKAYAALDLTGNFATTKVAG